MYITHSRRYQYSVKRYTGLCNHITYNKMQAYQAAVAMVQTVGDIFKVAPGSKWRILYWIEN